MRIIGAGFLVVGMTFVGRYFAERYRRGTKELEYIHLMLRLLEGEITYHGNILEEAFLMVSVRTHGHAARLAKQIAISLKGHHEDRFAVIWKETVTEIYTDRLIDAEEVNYLLSLGDQLGYLDKQVQIATLKHYQMVFEETIMERKALQPARCKMYNCLGMMLGIFITIVLY